MTEFGSYMKRKFSVLNTLLDELFSKLLEHVCAPDTNG